MNQFPSVKKPSDFGVTISFHVIVGQCFTVYMHYRYSSVSNFIGSFCSDSMFIVLPDQPPPKK